LKVQDLPRPDALDAAEQTPHLLLISERDPGDTRTPLLGLGPHLQKDHGGGFIYNPNWPHLTFSIIFPQQ